MGKPTTKAAATEVVRIEPIKMATNVYYLEGTAPLGINRFSEKAQRGIEAKQEAGSTAGTKKVREKRDFESDFQASMYLSPEGWCGINAACFRNAMISMCRVAGFVMVRAKLAVFIEADGHDKFDGTPLVRIYGEPHEWRAAVRNANGTFDIRSRARWDQWKMRVRITYDTGVFTASDIANLMTRVGVQGGIGEGRPDSKNGPGIGMGLFRLTDAFDAAA